MPDQVVFESPVVRHHLAGGDGPLVLADASATTKLSVRSDAPQFQVAFGSSRAESGALICGVRPGEWLVLGDAETASAAAAGAAGGFTNVIDITHGRAMFRVSGAAAPAMLEKVCSLNWSDPMTPDGAVTSASVAKTTCDVIRNDVAGNRSYLLLVDRSYGQYLFDALLDAGDELGVIVG